MNTRQIPCAIYDPSNLLDFFEERHEYFYDGELMDSVTKVIKSYCEPFDAFAVAERIANRDGLDKDQLLQQWKDHGDAASRLGTYVHGEAEYIADLLQANGWLQINTRRGEYAAGHLQALWRWFGQHIEIAQGWLLPEFRIAYPEYRLAGTVDLLASSLEGVPAIVDFKTSREIDVLGYRNMLAPFARGKLALPDASYYKYALQMNLYMRILADRYEFEAERMVLVHLASDGYFYEYEVPEMPRHVDAILKEKDDG